MVQLGSAHGIVEIDFSSVQDGVQTAQGALNSFQSGFEQTGRQLRAVGQDMTWRVTAPIVGMGGAALKMAGDFQSGMNQVQALTGATGHTLDALERQAKELGRTTQFSAGQAASAMGFLAMAGFEADQILAAMPGTLQLAASANMDLATTADIVSNILTGYGKDVADLAHVNDVLVAAMTNANTDLRMLGEAMKYAAPVASAMNVQFEEATAALGLMGNAGIQASMAGTSLRGALTRLANPTRQVQDALERLGIVTHDAQGELLPLVDIVRQLENSGASAGDMMLIFGQRAGPAMQALVDQGADALEAFTDSLENSAGTAARIADVQMRGLNGSFRALRSAVEGLAIEVAQSGLLDWVTGLVQRSTALVQRAAELNPSLLRWATILGLVAAAIGPLLIVLGTLVTAIGALLSPIGLVVVALAGLGAAWAADFGGIRTRTNEVWAAVQPSLQQLHGWLAGRLPDALASLRAGWSAAWSALPGVLETVQGRLQATWEQVQAGLAQLVQFLTPSLARVRASFVGMASSVGALVPKFQALWDAVLHLWETVQPVLTLLGRLIAGALGVTSVVAVNLLAATFRRLTTVVGTVLDQFVLLIDTLANVIGEFVTLVVALMQGDWQTAWQAAGRIVQAFTGLVSGTLRNLWTVSTQLFGLIADTVRTTLEDMGVDTQRLMRTLQAWWERGWSALLRVVTTIWEQILVPWEAMRTWLTVTLYDALSDLAVWTETQWDAIKSAVDAAVRGITSTFQTLRTWLTVTLQSAVTSFRTFLEGVSLPNPFAALERAIDNVRSAIDAVREKIEAFVTWIGGISIPNPFSGLQIPGIPGFARGTLFAPGGLALVGERGPELVDLPRGARVYSAAETRRMSDAPVHIENHFYVANDLDVESVARRVAQVIQRRGR